jgi:hypothetical protein
MAEALVTMGLSHAEPHAPALQGAALRAIVRGSVDLTSNHDVVEELCGDTCTDLGEGARYVSAYHGSLTSS